jgi:hypothetical protein
MSLVNEFKIDFISSVEFEWLAVEILFRGQRLMQLNREKGIENIEIEILTDIYLLPETVEMKFSLDDFISIISEAKKALISAYE